METREEIRTKWIRHTPHLKLDDCVDNAMQEYADIVSKPLQDRIKELEEQNKLIRLKTRLEVLNEFGERIGLDAEREIDEVELLLNCYLNHQ